MLRIQKLVSRKQDDQWKNIISQVTTHSDNNSIRFPNRSKLIIDLCTNKIHAIKLNLRLMRRFLRSIVCCSLQFSNNRYIKFNSEAYHLHAVSTAVIFIELLRFWRNRRYPRQQLIAYLFYKKKTYHLKCICQKYINCQLNGTIVVQYP